MHCVLKCKPTATLTIQVMFVLCGVGFANHSPDRPQTSKQPLQEPSPGGLALQPGVVRLAPDRTAVHILSLSLCPPGTPFMLVELQDAVGKVFLVFLTRCVVVAVHGLTISASGLDGSPCFYGEDIAQDALSGRQVHLGGAWRFCVEPPK